MPAPSRDGCGRCRWSPPDAAWRSTPTLPRVVLAVAVLAEDGTPLDGFGAADCMPLRADRVRHGMRWSGGDRLPGGRPVRLQFNLRDADLYSFRLRA